MEIGRQEERGEDMERKQKGTDRKRKVGGLRGSVTKTGRGGAEREVGRE